MEMNNSIKELSEMVRSFKTETANLLRTFMDAEEERSKKFEKLQHNLIEQNTRTINDLKSTVQRIGTIIAESPISNSNINNSSSYEVKELPVSESNTRRLLETFDSALEKAAEQLSRYNAEIMEKQAQDINNYINSFSETMAGKFEFIIEKYTQSLDACFEKKIAQFSENMNEYMKSYTNKNVQLYKEALSDVQKENNNELEKLSESLKNMSDSNNVFINKCTENNGKVNSQVSLLIEQHDSFVDKLKEQTDYNLSNMNTLMNEKIDELSIKLNELETKNAELFHNSMDKYRDNFVEANAEALAKVQGNLHDAVAANQEHISNLTEQVDSIADTLNDFIETVETQKEENDQCINNALKSIERSGEDANKKMVHRYDDVNDMIEGLIEELSEISNHIKSNTEAYNNSLNEIRENQRRSNELSKKDIELLEGMMRRSGV